MTQFKGWGHSDAAKTASNPHGRHRRRGCEDASRLHDALSEALPLFVVPAQNANGWSRRVSLPSTLKRLPAESPHQIRSERVAERAVKETLWKRLRWVLTSSHIPVERRQRINVSSPAPQNKSGLERLHNNSRMLPGKRLPSCGKHEAQRPVGCRTRKFDVLRTQLCPHARRSPQQRTQGK